MWRPCGRTGWGAEAAATAWSGASVPAGNTASVRVLRAVDRRWYARMGGRAAHTWAGWYARMDDGWNARRGRNPSGSSSSQATDPFCRNDAYTAGHIAV